MKGVWWLFVLVFQYRGRELKFSVTSDWFLDYEMYFMSLHIWITKQKFAHILQCSPTHNKDRVGLVIKMY